MFSRVVRQTHMYLGLFLAPWIFLYAISTVVMNHRPAFRLHFGGDLPWQKESEQILPIQFSADASPTFMGDQVLSALRMDGNSRATLSKDKKTLIVVRNGAFTPRRITYSLADGHLLVEIQQFATQPFLERMHRRRGYGGDFLADNGWAFSVDAVVAGSTFWVLSGLWMWWELKVTRLAGAAVALSGIALFTALIFAS